MLAIIFCLKSPSKFINTVVVLQFACFMGCLGAVFYQLAFRHTRQILAVI